MKHANLNKKVNNSFKTKLKTQFTSKARVKDSIKSSVKARLLARGKQLKILARQNVPMLVVASLLIICVMTAPTFGVTVESLKAPVKNLKDTIFGGWMWVPKIGAAVGGCVMAVYQQSIVPLATGTAIGLGIHFYDGYFGDPTAGALI